jgi:hypothetical protein
LRSGTTDNTPTGLDSDAEIALDSSVEDAALDASLPPDVGEPAGVPGRPGDVGCADGTREGFRDIVHWPSIAGCAGGFAAPGVLGTPKLTPVCNRMAGDTSVNPTGAGCNAADLCAAGWHMCQNGYDVSQHSPTGDCESCVLPGEQRFFLVASGASLMGQCSPDPSAANDLHGCGGLGQPESEGCQPLTRRMGFADCLATNGVWLCGSVSDSQWEAKVVSKSGPTLGGTLCCQD